MRPQIFSASKILFFLLELGHDNTTLFSMKMKGLTCIPPHTWHEWSFSLHLPSDFVFLSRKSLLWTIRSPPSFWSGLCPSMPNLQYLPPMEVHYVHPLPPRLEGILLNVYKIWWMGFNLKTQLHAALPFIWFSSKNDLQECRKITYFCLVSTFAWEWFISLKAYSCVILNCN